MIRLFLLTICLLLNAVPARAETRFFDQLGDVPVMPALMEVPERTIVFDKPEGRIAQVTAVPSMASQGLGIEAFYEESLPQLGWQKLAPGRYRREGQILTIAREREGDRELVIFRIEPR